MTFSYQKQKQNKKTNWLNIKFLSKLLLLLVAAEGIFYVASINDLVVKGFKLQELKNYSIVLNNENKNIDVQVASLKSYHSLAQRVDGLSMVAANNIDYIKITSGELAVK